MNLKNHFFMKMGGVLLTSGTLLFSAPLSSTARAADGTETVMKQAIMQGKEGPKKRTITGVITDAIEGTPVVGATIKIKGQSAGQFRDWMVTFHCQSPARMYFKSVLWDTKQKKCR